MTYTGNICDGCGKAFNDGDDVVVCPECATPQHRECYEKNNSCVNSHLHGEEFLWKGAEVKPKATLFKKQEQTKDETSACPNCGHENPKGSKQCAGCGMKLMVFGIDLADSIEKQNQEPQVQNENNTQPEIPHYEAPFTLGEGEGFEEEENKPKSVVRRLAERMDKNQESDDFDENEETSDIPEVPPTPEQIQQSLINSMEQSGHQAYYDSYVDGVHVNLLATVIGPNAYKYIEKFKKMELGKKVSFNWAAFFFTPYWFFYRKLYKAGIVIMTVITAISIAFTPSMLDYMKTMQELAATTPADYYSMSEAELFAFSEQMTNQMMELMIPIFIMMLIIFVVHLISGFIANKLYKKQTMANAKNIIHAKNKGEAGMLIAKFGGVSVVALLISYLAEQLLGMIISYLMF